MKGAPVGKKIIDLPGGQVMTHYQGGHLYSLVPLVLCFSVGPLELTRRTTLQFVMNVKVSQQSF